VVSLKKGGSVGVITFYALVQVGYILLGGVVTSYVLVQEEDVPVRDLYGVGFVVGFRQPVSELKSDHSNHFYDNKRP
jgi:hypothetical protein